MRLLAGMLVLMLVAGPLGCRQRKDDPGVRDTAALGDEMVGNRATNVEQTTPMGATDQLADDSSGCVIHIPDGWLAYRVNTDPDSIVRLVRETPPRLLIEIWRGTERVPDGGEGFFDRGPYLNNGQTTTPVAVWTIEKVGHEEFWRVGVLLQRGGTSLVVEGQIPEVDFEAGKRAFDALVRDIELENGI